MTPAEIAKLLADYQAGHAIGLYDKIDDLACLALEQARELATLRTMLQEENTAMLYWKDNSDKAYARIAKLCAHIRSLLMSYEGVPMTGIYAGQIADKARAALKEQPE